MRINELIDELESELTVKKGFFSRKVDFDRCAFLIDELKKNVPQTMRDVNYVLDNKQKILDNADMVAKNTIKAAEDRAKQLTQSTEVIRLARLEANRIMDQANSGGDMLIAKTKEHLDNMFLETEQFLLSVLEMIRTNREELRRAFIFKNNKA